MKEISKKDDFIFRLLFLKAKFMTRPVSKKYYSNQKTYITSQYDKVNPNFNSPKISILALDKVPNLSKMLPYDALVDDIVITKNYDLLATWEIVGVPFEVENDEILNHQKNMINMLLRQFDNKNVAFYCHSVRHSMTDKFENSKFKTEFLKDIDSAYFNGFSKDDLKQNRYFLTAIYSPLNKMALRSAFKKNKLDKRIKEMNGYVKIFRDYCENIEANLSEFNTTRLKSYEIEGVKFSKQLEFYNFLISVKFQKVRTPNAPVSEYLNGNLDNIMFATSAMQLNFNDGSKRFAKAIEIKDYPNETWAGVFDLLMYENIEYIITQSFVPMPKVDAKTHIERQQKRLNSAEDDAVTQIVELDEALNDLISGEFVFGSYHFSIVVFGNTIKEVEKNANLVSSVLGNNLGFLTSSASIALPATYFSQFPANFDMRPRIHTITSKNYASLIGFHAFLTGMRSGNVWGNAVTILKTPNKQPYYFNWHNTTGNDFTSEKTQLGNSVILGVSRGG
nr:type IV secretion system protein VirB4 [Campylobacter sp.]